MSRPAKHAFGSVLGATAKGCFVLSGLSFWVGGGLIHSFFNVERFTAEAEGLALAAALLVLGFLLKSVADGFDDSDKADLTEE
jgi:hypothetical protein